MSSKAEKSSKYSSSKGDGGDGIENLSDKLAQDLRRHIRQIGNFPVLSPQWLDMAETFGRMATISDMESTLAASKGGEGTLWETDEQALRFLLEDGKLNVCMRCLVEYKGMQRSARESGGTGPVFENAVQCDKFEKGLGVVLKNVWNHVEALQTTDLSTMLRHVGDVLETAIKFPADMLVYCRSGDIHQRQEVLVLYYIGNLLHFADDISESRYAAKQKLLSSYGFNVLLVLCVNHRLGLCLIFANINYL